MKNKSRFIYKVSGDQSLTTGTGRKVEEELNRGISFCATRDSVNVVLLSGEAKDWVTVDTCGSFLSIDVDDSFFSGSCILEQILTCFLGNLLDFGALRLEEFILSPPLSSAFISGNLGSGFPAGWPNDEGAYFGTILKPSNGLSFAEKLTMVRQLTAAGCVLIKEDETYLKEKRVILKEAKEFQAAMNSECRQSWYVPNATPFISDVTFLDELQEVGIHMVMVNYLVSGLPAVLRASKQRESMLFWGHRVGYEAVKRSISMKALSVLAAYSGIDVTHIGTPLLARQSDVEHAVDVVDAMRKVNDAMLPVFTKVSSDIARELIDVFGRRIVLLACGAIRTDGAVDWRKVEQLAEEISCASLS